MTVRRRLAAIALFGLLTVVAFGQDGPPDNLVVNSDLEQGQAGGSAKGWHTQKEGGAEGTVALTDKEAHSGKLSFLIDHANDTGFIHPNAGFPLTRGEYIFRFWAKSTADIEFTANLYWAGKKWETVFSRSLKLAKDEWRKFEFPVAFIDDFPASIQIGLHKPGRMWLDDVELIQVRKIARTPAAQVWDTGTTSPDPLTPQALAQSGRWTARTGGDAASRRFNGDAVLANDRLTLVVRRGAAAAELYSRSGETVTLRARLRPLAGSAGALKSDSIDLIDQDPDGARIRVAAGAASVEFCVGRGKAFVETVAGAGVRTLRIESPSRFAVLPDFFADDLVIDAARIRVARAELPSENFLMQPLGRGDAIVFDIAEARDQDMEVTLNGEGEGRQITGAEIGFGKKGGKIWVAVLEGPRIWHTVTFAAADAGRKMDLNWKAPFPAQWRIDCSHTAGLFDSWEMLIEQSDGSFAKPGWLGAGSTAIPASRQRWTTVLGTFNYPFWIDQAGRGFAQPFKNAKLTFDGPAVIYPANRTEKTPLDVFTVVDLVRDSLGVGPCQYVLDVEGTRSQYKGLATCALRDLLTKIYSAGQQKPKRADVEKGLSDMIVFVKFIRGRIELYRDFAHQIRGYLAEQTPSHPQHQAILAELDRLTQQIDARIADRRDKIKTPEEAAAMVEEFRKNVMDYEGPDLLDKVKAFTAAMVVMGGNQDELAGECRWAVKALRQRAGLAVAEDTSFALIGHEIRSRTQSVLRNPASHEGARH